LLFYNRRIKRALLYQLSYAPTLHLIYHIERAFTRAARLGIVP
jgi:hypothetical protein